ncbi:MAG: hypothetical protein ABIL09_17960 [Gemmatimonadota bacterium]
MKMRTSILVLGLVGTALLVGCGGEPPTADLDAAGQSLQAAKTAGAEKYASSQLSAAQQAYDKAKSAYDAEADKLFKNWDETKSLLTDAKTKSDRAASAAAQAKAAAKSGAEAAIADAAAAISAARDSLAAAPAGKGTEGDVEQLRTDLDGADADLSAARTAAAREDYDTAAAKAASAKTKAVAVSAGVEQAVTKYQELVVKNRPWYLR